MNKVFSFLILLFSFSSFAKADWDPYVMTKEKFVHLTPEQQREVVIKTMEIIVTMEQAIPKDYEIGIFDSEKNQKVVELFQKLQGFIISSAYAQSENNSLVDLAKNFNNLISTLKTDACIYAGYVSRIAYNGKDSYCPHPMNVKVGGKVTAQIKKQITDAYLKQGQTENNDKSGRCSLSEKKVSCNPVVFGYKKDSTPFCVSTSYLAQGEPQNVAYNCMRASLGEDSVNRLNEVSEALAQADSAVITNVHQTLFKMCVCGNQGSINQDYQEYMRGHRTCLGLMKTLKNVNNSVVCSTLTESNKNLQEIEAFERFFLKDISILSSPEPTNRGRAQSDQDKAYASLIEEITKDNSVRNACELEPIPTEPEIVEPDPEKESLCSVEQKTSEEDPKMVTLTLKFKEGLTATPIWPEGITSSEDGLSAVIEKSDAEQIIKIPFSMGENKKSTDEEACSATIPPLDGKTDDDDDKKYAITAKSQAPGPINVKVIATITMNGVAITEKIAEENLKVIWHYKNFPSTKPKETPKPSSRVMTEEEKAGEVIENKDSNRQDNVSQKPEVDAPRSIAEYEACAELIKGEKVIGTACDKVAPIQNKPANMNPGIQQRQGQPMFMNNKRNIGF